MATFQPARGQGLDSAQDSLAEGCRCGVCSCSPLCHRLNKNYPNRQGSGKAVPPLLPLPDGRTAVPLNVEDFRLADHEFEEVHR